MLDCSIDNISDLDLLFTVPYILEACCLQVAKVTKGALIASQSEAVGDSIYPARPEHLHRAYSIPNSLNGL